MASEATPVSLGVKREAQESGARFGKFVAEKILTRFHQAVSDDLDVPIGGNYQIVVAFFLSQKICKLVSLVGRHDAVKRFSSAVLAFILFYFPIDA